MCTARATGAEVGWLIQYAQVAPAEARNLNYVPLLMALPLLAPLSDTFVRQLSTMTPMVADVYAAHADPRRLCWALPHLVVREIQLSAGRAQADCAALRDLQTSKDGVSPI